MANYKKVDADQLNAGLTSVANAIRERAGTEDQLAFPDGFVSAVEGIPDLLAKRLNNTLTEYVSSEVTALPGYALRNCSNLVRLELPNCWDVGMSSFVGCTGLVDLCFPSAEVIGTDAFNAARNLTTLDLPIIREIRDRAFTSTNLTTLIIRKTDKVCTLGGSQAINNNPIASGTGYIYVPRALVDSYKAATNWSTYANQIRAIEDYPEITGG